MKKIMFNDKYGLTRAVLEGRKTMTRRAVKFPTKFDWGFYHYPIKPVTQEGYRAFVELLDDDEFSFEPERYVSSRYAVGEIIAIAQSYATIGKAVYGKPYKNKMFVRAEDMPHHIQITGIRVQNLQDISDEDCLKEGVLSSDKYAMPYGIPEKNGGVFFYYSSPREAFAALIDKVSGKGTWESNPLVWVYEFKLID